eukprot:g13248.t1
MSNVCDERPRLVKLLPACVFFDMLGVALVLPLMQEYFKRAGLTVAARELSSSLFSTSQIAGGVALGVLADSGKLSRQQMLLLSFGGSAVSYTIVGLSSSLSLLLTSRVIVGLVKQTMTVATGLIAEHSTIADRPAHLGRLGAAVTAAWVLGPRCSDSCVGSGPSLGGVLYRHVSPSAPALTAATIFAGLTLTTSCLQSNTPQTQNRQEEQSRQSKEDIEAKRTGWEAVLRTVRACVANRPLRRALLALVLVRFVSGVGRASSIPGYYEALLGIETHQRGYLASYQSLLALACQAFGIKTFVKSLGGVEKTALITSWLLAGITILESISNFYLFLGLVSPLYSMGTAALQISLDALLTQVTLKEALGSTLAAVDVVMSGVSVMVSLYRALKLPKFDNDMRAVSRFIALHWAVLAVSLTILVSRLRLRSENIVTVTAVTPSSHNLAADKAKSE